MRYASAHRLTKRSPMITYNVVNDMGVRMKKLMHIKIPHVMQSPPVHRTDLRLSIDGRNAESKGIAAAINRMVPSRETSQG